MRSLAAVLLLALSAAPAVWACSCDAPPSPTDAFSKAPLVFVGQATSIDPPEPAPFAEALVHMRVEKPYKGVKAGQIVTLRQGGCAGLPTLGETILLYVLRNPEDGSWYASVCFRTRRLVDANDDLRFLDALPRSARRTRVSGTVSDYYRRGVSGVAVKLHGPDGTTTAAITDTNGVYEVYDLLQGEFTMTVDVPRRMKLSSHTLFSDGNPRRSREKQIRFTLAPRGGAGADFDVVADNRLAGSVFDPDGKPMRDVCVSVVPVTIHNDSRSDTACSDKDGQYVIDDIPSGSYRLVANQGVEPSATEPFAEVYYPGTPDRANASIVTIHDGEHRDNLNLRIPAVLPRIRLRGRVEFADGRPVAQARVSFLGNSSVEYTTANDDGQFELPLLRGQIGELQAEFSVEEPTLLKCRHFLPAGNEVPSYATVQSTGISLTADADQLALRVSFPFPSCKHFPVCNSGACSGK